MGRDVYNNSLPVTIFAAIIALNIGIVINYLAATFNTAALGINSVQIYVLLGLEIAVILAAYRIYRRSNSMVSFYS